MHREHACEPADDARAAARLRGAGPHTRGCAAVCKYVYKTVELKELGCRRTNKRRTNNRRPGAKQASKRGGGGATRSSKRGGAGRAGPHKGCSRRGFSTTHNAGGGHALYSLQLGVWGRGAAGQGRRGSSIQVRAQAPALPEALRKILWCGTEGTAQYVAPIRWRGRQRPRGRSSTLRSIASDLCCVRAKYACGARCVPCALRVCAAVAASITCAQGWAGGLARRLRAAPRARPLTPTPTGSGLLCPSLLSQ